MLVRRLGWSRVAAVFCVVVLLGGCADFTVLGPREPVTVRFTAPGAASYYEPLVEAFEDQHRNITIELVDGMFFGYEQLADVDVIIAPQSNIADLIDGGFAMSLHELIAQDDAFDLADFYPGAVEALTVQGQRWAIPYMADAIVMFYNRDLYDKHNVPYPDAGWTWQGFLDRAVSLTDESVGEYGYAYQLTGQMAFIEPMLLIYQHGGQVFDNPADPTALTLNEPLNVEALQWYADLIHRHGVAPPPVNRQMPFPQAGVEAGKYAMWLGFLSDRWEELNVGVAPVPGDANAVTLGAVLGLFIRADTQDPQACWEWVKFVTNEAPPFLMPARRSLAEAGAAMNPDFVEAGRASLETMLPLNLNLDPTSLLYKQWGTIMQAFTTAVVDIQNGDPVGPALDEAQRKVDF